ncbi:MAG: TRAP transporter small permease subunit [Pseudomonadales bacterium]|nr:TRAP transporter small permease subunit [Pseudomonadales bacterium]
MDTVSEFLGRSIAWLTLLMMVAMFSIVVLRYIFNVGSIALQESVTYLHAIIFMTASGYTLKHNGHVRVDIFYRNFSPKRQALVDLLGGVFLLIPVCCAIFWFSWDYVAASWSVGESSSDAGGLPYVYLLKSLIIILSSVLLFQGIAESVKNLMFLLNKIEFSSEKPEQHL